MKEKILNDIEFVKNILDNYESYKEWIESTSLYDAEIKTCNKLLDSLREMSNSKYFRMKKEKWEQLLLDAEQIGLDLTEYKNEELETLNRTEKQQRLIELIQESNELDYQIEQIKLKRQMNLEKDDYMKGE